MRPKRILAALLAVVMVVVMIPAGVVADNVVLGDVNTDGKINLNDVSIFLKYIAKWDVTINLSAADVDGSNKVNLTDVSLILKYIAKWDVPFIGGEIRQTISGDICGASEFHEGLAFVCVNGNKDKTYCIDKDGYIIFELDINTVVNGEIYKRFKGDFALIDGAICDKKGNLTYPESVGATKFYDIAFEGGYIVAERVTSDYASSKKRTRSYEFFI